MKAVQLTLDLGGSSGKTSLAVSQAIKGTTSPQSSIRWENSGGWNRSSTECWTHNGSELPNDPFPNGDGVYLSSLVSILEPQVADKYYLSVKACRGILTRASKRGRSLPGALQAALEAVAGSLPTTDES